MIRLLTLFSAIGLLLSPEARGASCELCENPDGHPIVHLNAASIDSVGRAISDRNLALIEAIEEAYATGEYGEVGKDDSREDAMAALMFNAETAFDFFLSLALQEERIYSMNEGDLREAFTKGFRNPGLYPIVNLLDARAGFGGFCLRFDVWNEEKRKVEVSGEEIRAWTEHVDVDDERLRVVNIDMVTMAHDRVHVVYEEHSCGVLRRFQVEEEGHTFEVVTMEELSGQYVRKFGFHRPEATVLWKARGKGITPPPEEGRLIGSAIYFPHLQLKLPWFLPNIGFHDLRQFDFPEPLLSLDHVELVRNRKYDWVEIRNNYRFAEWKGDGEVPDFVEERFPDDPPRDSDPN